MYIKVGKKKYDVIALNTLWLKFKSLKFYFEPIEDIYRLKKKGISTYLFCQKIDIIMTDKDNKIIHIYKSFGTEKIIFARCLCLDFPGIPRDEILSSIHVGGNEHFRHLRLCKHARGGAAQGEPDAYRRVFRPCGKNGPPRDVCRL